MTIDVWFDFILFHKGLQITFFQQCFRKINVPDNCDQYSKMYPGTHIPKQIFFLHTDHNYLQSHFVSLENILKSYPADPRQIEHFPLNWFQNFHSGACGCFRWLSWVLICLFSILKYNGANILYITDISINNSLYIYMWVFSYIF